MRYLSLCLLLLLLLGVAACNNGDEERGDFENGVLVNTPSGGTDFGLLQHFDVATHQATISNTDDADGYTLTLANDALIMISVESLGTLNPFVELYDVNGFFVTDDDDGGIATDSLIVGDFSAGDYTIVVWSSLAGPRTGDYELNVIVGSPGADLEILDIGVTTTLNDIAMAAGDDAQSYIFTLESPATVDFDVVQGSGTADLALQLVDQRGIEVFFFDPEGLADPVVLDEPLDNGTYMLIVSNQLNAGAGVYDLTVDVKP
jgi:hypothetical protein